MNFTLFGFYPGFSDLLYNLIVSDSRSNSEVWLVSVLLKLLGMGVSDKSFIEKVEKLIDQNAERFANSNALVKFIIFTHVLAT